jgi:integrase
VNRPRKYDKHLPRGMYFRRGKYYHASKHTKGIWKPLGGNFSAALVEHASIIEAPKGGMAELIEAALAHILIGKPLNTCKSYKVAGRKLKKIFAEFSPEQVKSKHVVRMKKALISTPNLANRCLTVLRLVFDYALEEELLESNPVTGVKGYREAKRTRLVSLEEYAAIYAKATPRLQVIMDLCIRTGQRISDVLKIRRADLTDEGIRFVQQKTGAKGTVPWTTELRAVVDRAKTLHGNLTSLLLLHNRRGKAISYWLAYDGWKKARKAAGVPDARIHDLRAVAATWAKKQGKNATTLLMHSSPAQTERYLRDKEEPVVDGPSFGHLLDGIKK